MGKYEHVYSSLSLDLELNCDIKVDIKESAQVSCDTIFISTHDKWSGPVKVQTSNRGLEPTSPKPGAG